MVINVCISADLCMQELQEYSLGKCLILLSYNFSITQKVAIEKNGFLASLLNHVISISAMSVIYFFFLYLISTAFL